MQEILPRSSRYLNVDQFFLKFVELFDSLKNDLLKYECLQTYEEPDNASYQAMMQGEREKALHLISENVAREKDWFVRCAREGIQQVRVRAVELPLTPYLEWEFNVYQEIVQYGQRILIFDLGQIDTNSVLRNGSDFLIFDRKVVLAHNYNQLGSLQGAWLIEEPMVVDVYNKFFDEGAKASVPLGVFQRGRLSM